jgi:hypothetical protein
MANENPTENENGAESGTDVETEMDKRRLQVGRGSLERRLLHVISRHPRGVSERPLVTAAVNMGSSEKSAKQCLRRLVKAGKLQRTHRGWKLPQDPPISAGKTLPSSLSLKPKPPRPSKPPKSEPVSRSSVEPMPDRDLDLAVALLEIESLPKERQDRVRYLASLLVSKKIRVF